MDKRWVVTAFVTVCSRPDRAQAVLNPSTARESWHKVALLGEELLATDSSWKRRSVFFKGVTHGRLTASSEGPHAQGYGKHRLDLMGFLKGR